MLNGREAALTASDDIPDLEQRRESILRELAAIGDLRPRLPGPPVHEMRQPQLPLPPQGRARARPLFHTGPQCRWKAHFALGAGRGGHRDASPSRRVPALPAPVRRADRGERAIVRCPAGSRHRRRGGAKKKACAQQFAPAIEAEIARLVVPGAADQLDFEALEFHVRRQALQLAARAVARRLNEDRSDHTGPTRACPRCGQQARYAGRRAKTFETVLTGMTLERACYWCAACGKGCFPRDAALGMARTDLSPGVTRMTGAAAGLVSFARASGLLADLAGVSVNTKHVERTAEGLGREIAAAERDGRFASEPPAALTMYLGVDGTGVPMRAAAVAGRRRQAGGRLLPDAREQGRRHLDGARQRQARPRALRRRLADVLGGHRKRR